VLRSSECVDDAYDNATAKSFVDGVNTELVGERVWQTRAGSSGFQTTPDP
jgi:hypothetical protein